MKNQYILKEFIANRIRIIRKSKNLSQEELSERAYLDIKYVNKLENLRNNIKIDTLEQLLTALDISYQDFFNFENPSVSENEEKILSLLKQLPNHKQDKINSALITLLENYKD